MSIITTPLTQQLGIKHPILLAGMGGTSTASLAAAVSNAGGLGVIGGVGYTPPQLQAMIADLKSQLADPSLPFGMDLLLPQVGGSARRTNADYTKGALDELVGVIIAGGARLFVSAVGACAAGADLICAQGGEAGGHTGDIPTGVLVPACAEVCAAHASPLTGNPVGLVAAGGISSGRSLASALMLGVQAVWVGTRFVAARESGASEHAKRAVLEAGFDSVVRSVVWTGRPLRALKNLYIADWEQNRQAEIRELTGKGIVPLEHELDKLHEQGKLTDEIMDQAELLPMGIVAGLVNKPDQTAKEIVDEIVSEASTILSSAGQFVTSKAKLQ
ncbi:2-nitropropane dioxygenase [Biscogniauxia marginata]|nr:2-nitropropane dioxygenase [Biscogniauxia marginata]